MATRTAFLAKLIGLYCILIGLAMAAHEQSTLLAVNDLVHNAALLFVFGLVVVAAGLAIILSHNIWSGGALPVIITIIGWLTLIKGLLFLLLPPPAAVGIVLWGPAYEKLFYLDVALVLILGLYLTYSGFKSKWGYQPIKALIVFDLDGTLAESKTPIDAEMSGLLAALFAIVKVAIISGADEPQFQKQVIGYLPHDAHFDNLSLLPTCGTKFLEYKNAWHKLYSEDLTEAQKQKIITAINNAVTASGFGAKKTWGDPVEDRGSQITYSALGQQAPLDEKKSWDPDFAKRKKIKALLDVSLPDFSVSLGGLTSIDVTLPGINKAYGIRKLQDTLGIAIQEMVYVGDALFPGGNDYPVRETGVVCIQVRDPDETKRVIEAFIACLDGANNTR
jgi:phosphomannomutase